MDLPIRDNFGPRDRDTARLETARLDSFSASRGDAEYTFAEHLTLPPAPAIAASRQADTAEREPIDESRNADTPAAADVAQPPPARDAERPDRAEHDVATEPPAAAVEADKSSGAHALDSPSSDAEHSETSREKPAAGAEPPSQVTAADGQSTLVPGTTLPPTLPIETAASETAQSHAGKSVKSADATTPATGAAVAGATPPRPPAADAQVKPTAEAPAASPQETAQASAPHEGDPRGSAPADTKQASRKPSAQRDQGKSADPHRTAETDKTDANTRAPAAMPNGDMTAHAVDSVPDLPLPSAAMADEAARAETGDAQAKTVLEPNPRAAAAAERLSDHLLPRGGSRPDTAGEMSHADQTRLIQRVARAIEAAPQRGGLIRLRLSPPELGSVQMEVTLHKGVLSARLETETPTARAVLLDNLPQLRERLAEQGLRVESFEVDVSRRDTGDSQHQPHDFRESTESPPANTTRHGAVDATRDVERSNKMRQFIHPGNLNVVI